MDWHCTEENPSEEEFEVGRQWYNTEMISLLTCLLFVVLWGWGGGERSGVGTGIVVIRIRIAVTYMYSH